VEAYEGESVAAALYAIGVNVFTKSIKLERPRGAFCMIGKCSSCFMKVDGIPNTRTCIEPVRDGMRVEVQEGLADIPPSSPPFEAEDEEVLEDVDVLVIGGGPAGLAATIALAKYGLNVVLVNEHFKLGGQLVKQTHKFFGSKELFGGLRGFQVGEELAKKVKEYSNVRILLQTTAYGIFRGGWVGLMGKKKLYRIKPRYIIASTGASERYLAFPGNDLPGVMGAGGAQTLMNEYGILPGEEVLVVGSGNVGVIVSYQLLQAGARVKAIVEILPHIGAWFVHAAKVRRYGVPILTRHTIKAAWGKEKVEGATIVQVDEKFQPIPGTERDIPCDLVLIAIGLTPDTRLFAQAGAVMRWIPELGGLVPLRTRYLETSVPGMYVAGDASGIEEATTAIIEGEIAGLDIVVREKNTEEARVRREKLYKFLWDEYRMSPVVARAREGKLKATVSDEEMEELRKKYPSPIFNPHASP
ncbi:MAG TPA: FAD-dependent oxidoreductase, partial [Desulfurococcaceae archaeon]|nr:FAD-dependent oxidoreductase [Desulfurococcaceae archaeon]